ncbi:MAG: AbrB/MazE/SpoVT family DNA-binding domain-containing protein [Ruminococcaceae bacterium]|nr:AbrB/MazE/SpoVT family DNA-binding domain-containing protein [Oscillospiraceae bacterium]
MKATGIVRRIDDLGRVVIPKEIRRTMRIREGDPLEIFTEKDGEVVFKKYSPVGELSPFAVQYADVLARACNMTVLVCDRDHVIAAAGNSRKEFIDRRVSAQLDEVMEGRQVYVAKAGAPDPLQPVEAINRTAGVAAPILASGDVTGAVCLLQPESGAVPGEGDVRLAQVAAAFLGKQMEE